MPESIKPIAIDALSLVPRTTSPYPAPFAARVMGRKKRALGDAFFLNDFGVNLTHLAPGTLSALHHRHSAQEEFIYILEGTPTLVTDAGEAELRPGMCAGFAPQGSAHHLVNRSDREVVYLEIGTRLGDDVVTYPGEDLRTVVAASGKSEFVHLDGTPFAAP